jgi:hypothetical protein
VGAKHDGREQGPSQYFVHQPELDLPVAGAAELRAEVAGPQPALLDALLQRTHQRREARIVDIPRAAQDVLERFDLVPHELRHPVELRLECRVGFKIPCHVSLRVAGSCEQKAAVDQQRLAQDVGGER